MSTELNTLLHNQLGDILQRHLVSKGENSHAIAKAIRLAIPTVVVGILAHVNGSKDKAMTLYNKIMDDKSELHHALSNVAASGSIPASLTELGQHFSSSLFGNEQADVVAAHIGKESGVSDDAAKNLLFSTVPLVLAILRGQSWSPAALYQVLSNQTNWLSKALPAGIMIALGIGSTAGLSASVAALASTLSGYVAPPVSAVASASPSPTPTMTASAPVITPQREEGGLGWGKALIWLILGALAVFGLRMCMNSNDNANKNKAPVAIGAASDVAVQAASEENIASDLAQSDDKKSAENSDSSNSEKSDDKKSSDSSKTPAANESRAVMENGLVKFYFATGFSRIAKNADEVAQEAIEAGKAGKKLIISGFTDSTGKAAANEKLSRKRAEVVKQFFVERGVDEKNIELRKPKNSVGAKGESQEGRRVEVQIKD